jgi:mannitol-specific phosphotransferase system IIBC component
LRVVSTTTITGNNISHMRPTIARRRQRSARLAVAVSLLVVSACVVFGTMMSGSTFIVYLGAVVAVLLGAAATRITHSELMKTRREAARDRAEQAREYGELDAKRTAEHKAQSETLTERIAQRQATIHELEAELSAAHKRLAEEHRLLNKETKRADRAEGEVAAQAKRAEAAEIRAAEAIVSIAALEKQLADLKAELAAWEDAAKRPMRKTS